MRNENLKNRLNELPQDFDQDQLWNAIDLPKKKKRNGGVFWIIGGTFFLLGMLIFSVLHIGNAESKGGIAQKSQKLEQQVRQNLELQKNQSKEEKETESQKIELTNTIEKQKIEQKNRAEIKFENVKSTFKNTSLGNSIPQKKIVENHKDPNSPLHNKSQVHNNIHSENKKIELDVFTTKNRVSDSEDQNYVEETIALRNNILQIDKSIRQSIKNDLNEDLESLSNIFLPLSIESLKAVNIGDDLFILKEHNLNPNVFRLSLFSLIGRSNHTFESVGKPHERNDNEKPLESISIGILGHFDIGNLEVFSGIAYSRLNTHLTDVTYDYITLPSSAGPIKRKITTQYLLYNSYQYMDLLLGIGYNVKLNQKWSLIPSIQMGYRLNSNPDGEIFGEEVPLLRLGDLDKYQDYSKWQGQVNLKLSRKINDYWEVGILAYLNSQKTLATFDDYTHKVSTKGIGVSLNRAF